MRLEKFTWKLNKPRLTGIKFSAVGIGNRFHPVRKLQQNIDRGWRLTTISQCRKAHNVTNTKCFLKLTSSVDLYFVMLNDFYTIRLGQGLGSCKVSVSVSSWMQNVSSRSRPERSRAHHCQLVLRTSIEYFYKSFSPRDACIARYWDCMSVTLVDGSGSRRLENLETNCADT